MRTFKVAVLEANGNWCFKWWNIDNPKGCGLVGPCKDKEEAEAEKQKFMEGEKGKFSWTTFEEV